MKMITKAIERAMPAIGSTEKIPVEDKPVIVKFFTPWTSWTWYVYEGEQQEDGDWRFFGKTVGDFTEYGEFLLSQLTEVRGPLGLKIERDMYYTWRRAS